MIYNTQGTCAKEIKVEVDHGVIRPVEFVPCCRGGNGALHLRQACFIVAAALAFFPDSFMMISIWIEKHAQQPIPLASAGPGEVQL